MRPYRTLALLCALFAAALWSLPLLPCGAETSGLQLKLSMKKYEWTDGEDVRLRVELRNTTVVPVDINTAAREGKLFDPAKIEFMFGTDGQIDKKLGVSSVDLAALFARSGQHPAVVHLPPRSTVSWNLSMPSCGIFRHRFPRGIILGPGARELKTSQGVFPGHRELTELLSAEGEYSIRAALVFSYADRKLFGARIESNAVSWQMVAAGKEIGRLVIDKNTRWQVITLAPREDDPKNRDGGKQMRLVYWRPAPPGAPNQPLSWEYGFVPYTLLARIDAAPMALQGAWFKAPVGGDKQEKPTDLNGFVQWHRRQVDEACGRCWVAYETAGSVFLAMLGCYAKSGPHEVGRGMSLHEIQSRQDGAAVLLLRSKGDAKAAWSYVRVGLRDGGSLRLDKAQPLPKFSGRKDVSLVAQGKDIVVRSPTIPHVERALVSDQQ